MAVKKTREARALTAQHIRLAQIYAIADTVLADLPLARLCADNGLIGCSGKSKMTQDGINKAIRQLARHKVIDHSLWRGHQIIGNVRDFYVQSAISDGVFEDIAQLLEQHPEICVNQYSDNRAPEREARLAFYRNDVAAFQKLTKGKRFGGVLDTVLQPFNETLFEHMDPTLQLAYLTTAVPRTLKGEAESDKELSVFESLFDVNAGDNALLASAIDLYVAQGNLESLRKLETVTAKKKPEIAGCIAMLTGDYDAASRHLEQAIPVSTGLSPAAILPATHLPGLFRLFLLLRQRTLEANAQAAVLAGVLVRKAGGPYSVEAGMVGAALKYQTANEHPEALAAILSDEGMLPRLVGGLLWQWFLVDTVALDLPQLTSLASRAEKIGLAWIAAELFALAGRLKATSSDAHSKRSAKLHATVGTVSLTDFMQPTPEWERALNAISHIAVPPASIAKQPQPVGADSRMIWEIDHFREAALGLRPVLQKRTKSGWTGGRYVAMKRLYELDEIEFEFLTDHDLAICNAIEDNSRRNHYGYTEESFDFNQPRLLKAIVGHPHVYYSTDRSNPVTIVQQQPHLVVSRGAKDHRSRKGTSDIGTCITVALNPMPLWQEPSRYISSDEVGGKEFRLVEEGPRQLAIVRFTPEQLKVAAILRTVASFPESAAEQIMTSLQSIAALIPIHSEIAAGEGYAGTTAVDADSRIHLHLLPYHAGLQIRGWVRPFGDSGPFVRPGDGAATVVDSRAGQTRTTHRDLALEMQRWKELERNCPSLLLQTDVFEVLFATVEEALECMEQLEGCVKDESVVIHWPQGQTLQLAGRVSESQLQLNIRRDHDWFAASGALQADSGLTLDLMRLMELVATSPSRFIRLDDGRYLALTARFRRIVEDLAAFGERRGDSLRIPGIRAAAMTELEETLQIRADKHWKEFGKRIRNAGKLVVTAPSTLMTELRDYQRDGFEWMVRLAAWGAGACLADDMGLGKTIQALAVLLHRAADGPALVVAPTSVGFNWQNELHRFAPTLNVLLFGPGDRDAALENLGPRDVVIASYGLLHSESERLHQPSWHTVILDEAQAIKNTATKRSQAAMGLTAGFRLIMTGTPLENHLGELWNLFQFINPGLLGSAEAFQQRFAGPIERDGSADVRSRLKRLIQPFILRRTKSQVLDELPPRTEITLKVQLSPEEAAFYEALRMRAVEKLADAGSGGAQHLRILAELMRLRRACCHPSLVVEDCGISGSKLALFRQTVEELLAGKHKVLVFSQFVDHLTILKQELEQMKVTFQYLDGSTPAKQRKERVEAFQSGQGELFLISLKAGGTGLNLTAADYVIHMDPWWNPAVEDQASDRAHRMGQQRPVTVYRLITEGTVEEHITALHTQKRDLADSLLDGTDVSGKLSADELLKLLKS